MAIDTGEVRPANGELPRLEHVQSHLPPRARDVLPLLLEAISIEEVAARLGAGYSRRYVDLAAEQVKIAYLPEGMEFNSPPAYARMRALRIAIGIEPCWCDG